MINIDYDKPNELKFTLDITGHVGSIDEIRFILDDGHKKVAYTGILEEGIVTVKLDNLNEMFIPGEHKYNLEIIIGNQYFRPIEDKINLKSGIKILSNVLEATSQESSGSVSVTKIESNKDIIEIKEPITEESKKKKIETKLSQFLVSDVKLSD